MLVCSVHLGRFAQGYAGLTRPPPLDSDDMDGPLYDSVVDNPARPTMYAVFNNSQVYPLYLVTYKIPEDWKPPQSAPTAVPAPTPNNPPPAQSGENVDESTTSPPAVLSLQPTQAGGDVTVQNSTPCASSLGGDDVSGSTPSASQAAGDVSSSTAPATQTRADPLEPELEASSSSSSSVTSNAYATTSRRPIVGGNFNLKFCLCDGWIEGTEGLIRCDACQTVFHASCVARRTVEAIWLSRQDHYLCKPCAWLLRLNGELGGVRPPPRGPPALAIPQDRLWAYETFRADVTLLFFFFSFFSSLSFLCSFSSLGNTRAGKPRTSCSTECSRR
jgi:hypothetical protein